MATLFWLKLYYEILDDYKMFSLSDRLYRRAIEFFLLAGEFDQKGVLPTPEVMAWRLHLKEDEVIKDLEELKKVGIVNKNKDQWLVTNFSKRQTPLPKKDYMRRLRDDNIRDTYYGERKETEKETQPETQPETPSEKKKPKEKSNISDAEDVFERIKTMWEADNSVVSRNILDRLEKCNVADDGHGKLLIIPKTKENGEWLKARALQTLQRQIDGIEDFMEVEIVL